MLPSPLTSVFLSAHALLYANELLEIKNYLGKEWECSQSHSFKEGDICADALAKRGTVQAEGPVVLNEAPLFLRTLLLAQSVGVPYMRLQFVFKHLVFVFSLYMYPKNSNVNMLTLIYWVNT